MPAPKGSSQPRGGYVPADLRQAEALERIAMSFEMIALACDRDSVQDPVLKEKLTRATTAARKRVAHNLRRALQEGKP